MLRIGVLRWSSKFENDMKKAFATFKHPAALCKHKIAVRVGNLVKVILVLLWFCYGSD